MYLIVNVQYCLRVMSYSLAPDQCIEVYSQQIILHLALSVIWSACVFLNLNMHQSNYVYYNMLSFVENNVTYCVFESSLHTKLENPYLSMISLDFEVTYNYNCKHLCNISSIDYGQEIQVVNEKLTE